VSSRSRVDDASRGTIEPAREGRRTSTTDGQGHRDGDPSRVRILAYPGFSGRDANPYTSLLYYEMEVLGCRVEELTPLRLVMGNFDVAHVHWPETLFRSPRHGRVRGLVKACGYLAAFTISRLRGRRLVWTAHNVIPHESAGRVEGIALGLFVRLIDGVILLNDSTLDELRSAYRLPKRISTLLSRHGHYLSAIQHVDRLEARERLEIPRDSVVIGFVGNIRRYKNVDALAKAFTQMGDERLRLIIGGSIESSAIKDELVDISRQDPRILLRFGFLDPEELSDAISAMNVVVLPYSQISNSGVAVMALSSGRPVAATNSRAIRWLEEQVGSEWVCLLDPPLSPESLSAVVNWASTERKVQPNLNSLSWEPIASDTVHWLRRLLLPTADVDR
jgi:beta-1,4-mannosyltransferase